MLVSIGLSPNNLLTGGGGAGGQIADLYILAGQSNARGTNAFIADAPSDLQGKIENVFIYNGSAFAQLEAGVNNDGLSNTEFGPELTMGRRLEQLTGRRVFVAKYALGATNLAVNWLPTSGAQWVLLKDEIDDAIAALESQGYTVRIKGMFWMQGETDAQVKANADNYKANLGTFFTQLRGDYAAYGLNTCPIVIGRIDYRRLDGSNQFVYQTQRAQFEYIQDGTANTYYLTTGDVGFAVGHYNAAGQEDLGERAAECIFYARNFPDLPAFPFDYLYDGVFMHLDFQDYSQYSINHTSGGVLEASSYTDKASGAMVFTGTTSEPQIISESALNRLPALDFNATDRHLYGTTAYNSNFQGADKQFSTVFQAYFDAPNATRLMLHMDAGTGNNRSWASRTSSTGSGTVEFYWQANAGGNSRTWRTPNSSLPTGRNRIQNTYNGAVDTNDGADRIAIKINKTSQSLTKTAAGTLIDIPSSSARLVVGAAVSGTDGTTGQTSVFDGRMEEIVAFDHVISSTTESLLNTYLDAKWGALAS